MRNFVWFPSKAEQISYEQQKKPQRTVFFILRALIFAFLMIAIASPFILETQTVKGNPRITILVDNSTSMNMFQSNLDKELSDKLKTSIPVTVRRVATGDSSAIGDGILNNIERDDNVLVISDGNNNDGKLLGDIMLLANSLNVTVSTLKMETIKSDLGISIEGPSEAILDTEETFFVKVNDVGKNVPYTLEVRFDDEIILAKSDDKRFTFPVTKKLTEGYHKITAELLNVGSEDYFKQNNIYYKSVKVVQRPRVLFVTEKNSPLASELGRIYDLETANAIPDNLNDYLAVILNDLKSNKIIPHMTPLSDYVSNGNGLFVIGGENSYDRGNYKGTLVETLLPVKVGAGEESQKNDINIVIIIDVSGTTGSVYNANTGQYEIRGYDEIIKAQAVSILESLNEKK